MPMLLITCDPYPESRSHFSKLMAQWDFGVLEAPLLEHGRTLDRLFRRTERAPFCYSTLMPSGIKP
jgi:hypothetical protein